MTLTDEIRKDGKRGEMNCDRFERKRRQQQEEEEEEKSMGHG